MKVLITGAGGQLATDLAEHCAAAGDEVIALDRSALDITDGDAVRVAVAASGAEAVVNAAAWTAVDACEDDEPRALAVNGEAVGHLGAASWAAGARFLHVSTDYVFDGTKASPYVEDDPTAPQSAYGRSKLVGEQHALAVPGATVVRVAWLCGAYGHNMVKTVLGLRDRESLAFVNDQRGSPTFTADAARAIRLLLADPVEGVVHVANKGEVTWYEFVRDILEVAGADPGIVSPISTAELDPPRPAPRPANSVLDTAVLRRTGRPELPHYRESLERVVRTLLA